LKKIFIDGSAGTTGLKIKERLSQYTDIQLITLSEEKRKDTLARKEALNNADIAFLCLPDSAAIEAVGLIEDPDTVIIDTSTAHRTQEGWTYGFPELVGCEAIKNAKRIANPGCHASGFLALIKPLCDAGIISPSCDISCFSVTGYSGGGKGMIAQYESDEKSELLCAPRQYGLTQQHKHLKEMQKLSGLEKAPLFSPIVADFYSGMEVTVPLYTRSLNGSLADIKDVYRNFYKGKVVFYNDSADEDGFLSAARYSMRDDMEVSVFGNDERIILTARYDNLGKGASGAAIQNMNIILGADETKGLNIGGLTE
jgi:N-acetyl-gamma-glutamyl-phosphate reductase